MKFQVNLDLRKELKNLSHELNDINTSPKKSIKLSRKVTTYKQALPIIDEIGQDVSEILGLEWNKIRGHVIKRTKKMVRRKEKPKLR
jgi:hypothetical protein